MIWLFFIFALPLQVYCAKLGISMCKNDADCDDDEKCEDNVCKKCLNCSLMFRQGNRCIDNFNQCGDCLNGYESTLVTDSSTIIKPCTLIEHDTKSEKCLIDKMCPPESYCLQNSCVRCFNCSLYNRLKPIEGCAKEFYQCGSCADGFYEVPVTTEWNNKPCKKVADSPQVFMTYSNAVVLYIFSITVVAALIVYVIYILEKKKKSSSLSRIYSLAAARFNELNQAPPPPYPSAPPIESMEMLENCKLFNKEEDESQVLLETEDLQTAKVFKQPSASYYFYTPEEEERLNNDSSSVGGRANGSSLAPECIGVAVASPAIPENASNSVPSHLPEMNQAQVLVGDVVDASQPVDAVDASQPIDASIEEDASNMPDMPDLPDSCITNPESGEQM